MKIEIIRNIQNSKIRIFNAHLMRIALNIIRKKYPQTDKKHKPQCHKNQENSRKIPEFRTKNRSQPRLLLEFNRVTSMSQTCHKYVTNTSQNSHKYVTKKVVLNQSCDFCTGITTIESMTITEDQIMHQNRTKVNNKKHHITMGV